MQGFAAFGIITTILSIGFCILSIILFFKVWGMTNDVRKLTQHFCKEDFMDNENINNIEIDISEIVNGQIKSRGVNYVVENSHVLFTDGKKGKITQFTNSFECSIVIDDNKELFYKDIYYACEALYEYLTNKEILKDGLIDK